MNATVKQQGTSANIEQTKDERAYRRGALQAVQFMKSHIREEGIFRDSPFLQFLVANWEQALIAGRESMEIRYLGHYCDEIRKDVEDVNRPI